MRNALRTVVAGFVPGVRPVNVHANTYRNEATRPEGMYRVVSRFADVSNPNVAILVPMTPAETRAYAAWLIAEAGHVDHMNNGHEEAVEPRVCDPGEWSDSWPL